MFPTLSAKPSSISHTYKSNLISVEYDGGYEQTRERNTRKRKEFEVSYQLITREDLNLLIAHYETVYQSASFSWTNDDNDTTYTVRYKEPFEYQALAQYPNRFSVTIKLNEV